MHARSRSSLALMTLALTTMAAACGMGSDAPEVGTHTQLAAATHFAFVPQPGNTFRNATFTVTVHALDGTEAIDDTYGDSGETITLAIGAGSGNLDGTLTVAAVDGVATFSGLSIDAADTGYTLTANGGALPQATSNAFDVAAFGPADHLAFTVSPGTTTAGVVIAPAVEVEVRDSADNVVTDHVGDVTLAFGNNPGGDGVLLGDLTNPLTGGVASFGDLQINQADTGYTVTASSGALVGDTSAAFDVTAAAAASVVFTTEPGNTAATATLAPSPVAEIRDAFGNLVPTATSSVTIALGANPGSSTLAGTTTRNAAAGVVTFDDLSLDKVGLGYTLTASSTGLGSDTTATFDIVAGTATDLVFTVQPGTTVAGDPFNPALVVEARDAGDNLATGFTGNVTLAIGNNPNSGTLSGSTITVAAAGGVATFGDAEIDRSGTGYTLTASATGVTGATSNAFNVLAGSATQLVITQEPSDVGSGAAISPAVTVEARDGLGNLDVGFTGLVTATKNSGPGAGTLTGTTAVNAAGGVATFSNLRLDALGSYTLAFNATGVTGDTSASFNVGAGAATVLVITAEPGDAIAGTTISTVTVEARDTNGNVATGFTGEITIAKNTGPGSGVLSGDTAVNAVAGVASFTDLSLDIVGSYTLAVSATGVTGDTSASFTISPAAAATLHFTGQPSTTTAGISIAPAVEVTARDAFGNVATGFTGTVTIAKNSGPVAGVLSGDTSNDAVLGVATFSDLSIDRSGSYTLSATASLVTAAVSSSFTINPAAATTLVITTEPSNVAAGAPISPAVVVEARDQFDNLASGFTGQVTATKNSGPALGGLTGSSTTQVNAVGGIATFSNLRLNLIGSYTLAFDAAGLAGDVSASFTVTPGNAATLTITGEPSNAVAGVAINPAVVVTAFDLFGNVATGYTGAITVAKNSGPASGVLSGTTTVNAVSGVASFGNLSINIVGTYTLVASATGLTSDTSASFTITPAAAASLAFTVQPSATEAGEIITPPVQVSALDAFGNVATGFTGAITVAKNSGPSNGNLGGDKTNNAVLGVATFDDLDINKIGDYTLIATATGLTSGISASFTIAHAVATQLAFSIQPTSTVAGVAIAGPVTVEVRDQFDNLASSVNVDITIAIGNNPGSGTLSGTLVRSSGGGDAAFTGISINKTGVGYTLTASAVGLTGATSAAFDITPAAATHLVFTSQPTDPTTAGVSVGTLTVEARDDFENLVPTFSNLVTAAIQANPGTSTLSGTTTATPVGGIATFTDLSLNKTGQNYSLRASATGVSNGISDTFDITPAAATHLVWTAQPSTTVAGVAIASPSPQVEARDQFENRDTNYTAAIVVAIASNPGSSTLSGTTSIAATQGRSTFTNLSLNKTGTGYTLSASSGALTGATSNGFNITPAAPHHFAFFVQPSTVQAGQPITPAVVVEARDQFENVATQYTGNITLSLAANPGSSTFGGTLSGNATAGSRTFANLTLNKVATGYQIAANGGGLIAATSVAFGVTPAPATKILYASQPTSTVAGVPITPAVTLTAFDQFDNVDTNFTGAVSIAILNNPGTSTLSGQTTVNAIAGAISFSTLSLNKVGSGYTLAASSGSLTGATSNGFNITPAPAAKLIFTGQPTSTTAGATITPAITLIARDQFDNHATTFNGAVSMAIANNPGGSNLIGTTTVTASSGNITFNNLSLNRVGVGYTLSATSTGLTPATSSAFNISPGAASGVFFTVQPTSATAGQAISPAVQVAMRDANSNVVTSFTGNITVAILVNPGSSTLSGTTTAAAVNGVATFADLSLDKVGSGYELQAASPGVASGTSAVFNITPAAAATMVFSVQPSNVVAGAAIAPSVQVTARDSFGNLASGFTGNVTVALGANPGLSTLGGTTTQAAVLGVASFPGLTLDRVATGYTLTASSAGLPGITSTTFSVSPAPPTTLVFLTQPTSSAAGSPIAPPVQVEARDQFGNRATQFSTAISLAIGVNPGGSVLGGSTSVAAVAGVSTFTGVSLDRAGVGYTLVATSGGLTMATSNTFEITPANASRLVFTVQPADGVAGEALTPTVRLEARDASGNLDTTFNGTVAVAIGVNPGNATLMGTVSMAASGGQVAFGDLSLDKVGVNYTLVASSGGLVSATSDGFDIVAAAADHLAFVGQPTDSVAGVTLSPPVRVEARDAFDNIATSYTGDITIAIGNNPNMGTLGGTATVAAVAGVATYAVSVDKVGTGYDLDASATGLVGDTSAAFDITPAPVTHLAFVVQPTNVAAGELIMPAVTVEARDAFENRTTSFTGAVTMGIGTNPGGSVLGGTRTAVAVGGVASFNDLTLDVAATGYTLAATSSGITGATSVLFNVTPGSASRLAFAIQPSNAVAGVAIAPSVRVEARDASGNLVPSFNGNVTVAISTNPGSSTLSGTVTRAAVAGVATFNDLSLDRQGTGYRLSAVATGFTSAISSPFSIAAGPASRLAVAQQPSDSIAASPIAPAVQIAAEDAFGNRVPSFAGMVTIAIGSQPGGANLGGTTTVTATGGVASFTSLTLDLTGTYTLIASTSGLTSVETDAFDVVSGIAADLAFATQPSTTEAGAVITPAVTVNVLDAQGNVDLSFSGNVSISIGINPGVSQLSGTVSVLVVNGVATFDDLSLDNVGSGYTLAAAAAGVPSVQSAPFDIVASEAVTFTVEGLEANTLGGDLVSLTITARDAHGNVATGYTGPANLTSSDDAIEAPSSATFTAGVAAAVEVSFHTVGRQTLTITDATEASVTGTVETNVTAVDAPMAVITSPRNGARVGGMVTIEAEGSVASTTELMSIEILVNDEMLATSNSSPMTVQWDTSSLPLGQSYTLRARVTDAEGNVTLSEPVTVTIVEGPDDGCGCRSASRGPGTPLLAGLVLLALLARPRRKRQGR